MPSSTHEISLLKHSFYPKGKKKKEKKAVQLPCI